ncbi:hypothetical protein BGX21_001824 [Mortierella sp. AD011]|nr:hypothetical protein BGX21_001824 [Mortierella sp. AD011]
MSQNLASDSVIRCIPDIVCRASSRSWFAVSTFLRIATNTPCVPPSIITDITLGAGEALLGIGVEDLGEISPYLAPRAEALRAKYRFSSEGTVHEAYEEMGEDEVDGLVAVDVVAVAAVVFAIPISALAPVPVLAPTPSTEVEVVTRAADVIGLD